MALYKTFFDFWFRPPNAQNLLPKICSCTKSPMSRLVWQIDQRSLDLVGGFWGWPIQWNHVKCCGADPCCHGNDIWPRGGDLVTYRLVLTYLPLELWNLADLYVESAPTGFVQNGGKIAWVMTVTVYDFGFHNLRQYCVHIFEELWLFGIMDMQHKCVSVFLNRCCVSLLWLSSDSVRLLMVSKTNLNERQLC